MTSGINIKQFKKFVEKTYGKKCYGRHFNGYEGGCCVCRAWLAYEMIASLLDDYRISTQKWTKLKSLKN